MKIIIDIPQDYKRVIDNLVANGNEYLLPHEVGVKLSRAVKIGTVIPDNATYGDVFEILLDTEPNTILRFDENFNDGKKKVLRFDKTWWNTLYKE